MPLILLQNNFSETLDFGRKSSCIIGKHGDLISKMVLQISVPQIQSTNPISWTNELGHSIVKKVEFLIGGVVRTLLTEIGWIFIQNFIWMPVKEMVI